MAWMERACPRAEPQERNMTRVLRPRGCDERIASIGVKACMSRSNGVACRGDDGRGRCRPCKSRRGCAAPAAWPSGMVFHRGLRHVFGPAEAAKASSTSRDEACVSAIVAPSAKAIGPGGCGRERGPARRHSRRVAFASLAQPIAAMRAPHLLALLAPFARLSRGSTVTQALSSAMRLAVVGASPGARGVRADEPAGRCGRGRDAAGRVSQRAVRSLLSVAMRPAVDRRLRSHRSS